MKFLITLLLIVILGAGGAGLFYLYQQNIVLHEQVTSLQEQLSAVQVKNTELEGRLQELEEASLGNIMEKTGEAIVHGWQSMLESVEEGLEEAQKQIQEQRNKHDTQQEQQPVEPATEEGKATSAVDA